MVPRGDVGIVVTQIGIGLWVLTNPQFGIELLMAFITTVVTPSALWHLYP